MNSVYYALMMLTIAWICVWVERPSFLSHIGWWPFDMRGDGEDLAAAPQAGRRRAAAERAAPAGRPGEALPNRNAAVRAGAAVQAPTSTAGGGWRARAGRPPRHRWGR